LHPPNAGPADFTGRSAPAGDHSDAALARVMEGMADNGQSARWAMSRMRGPMTRGELCGVLGVTRVGE